MKRMMKNKFAIVVSLALGLAAGAYALDIDWSGSPTRSSVMAEAVNDTAIPRPPAPAPAVTPPAAVAASDVSAIQMEDTLNRFSTRLTASAFPISGGHSYIITNERPSAPPPYSVEIIVRGDNDPIEAKGVGVSNSTPNDILARYGAAVDNLLVAGKHVTETGQIHYALQSKTANSRLELALIMFMVDEWFYY